MNINNKADIGLVLALISTKIQESTTSITNITPTAEGNGFIFTMSDGTQFTVVLSDMASQTDIDEIYNAIVTDLENDVDVTLTLKELIEDGKSLVTKVYVDDKIADLQTSIDSNSSDITTLTAEVTSNSSSIEGLNDINVEDYDGTEVVSGTLNNLVGNDKSLVTFDYLEKELTDIKDTDDTLTSEIETLKENVETNADYIEILNDTVVLDYDNDTAVNTNLGLLNSNSKELMTSDYFDNEKTIINSSIDNVQTQVNTNKSNIETLQTEVSDLENIVVADYDNTSSAEVDTNLGEIADKLVSENLLNYKLDDISSITDELETKVESLEDITTTNTANITTNTENIATNTSDIATNTTNIENNTNNISTNTTNIETNSGNITQNTEDIGTLTTTVDSLSTDVQTNSSNIESLEATVEENTEEISNLKTDVENNTTNIATNTSDITTLKTDVEQNTTYIGDVRGATVSNYDGTEDVDITFGDLIDESGSLVSLSKYNNDLTSIKSDISTNATSIDDLYIGKNLIAGTDIVLTVNETAKTVTINSESTVENKLITELAVDEDGTTIAVTYDDSSTGEITSSGFVSTSEFTSLSNDVTTNTSDITTVKTDLETLTTNVDTNTTDIADINTNLTSIEEEINTINTNVESLEDINVLDYDGSTESTVSLKDISDNNGSLISEDKYNNDIDGINTKIDSNTTNIDDLLIGNNVVAGDNITITRDTTNNNYTIASSGSETESKLITNLDLNSSASELTTTYDDLSVGTIETTGFVSQDNIDTINTNITTNTDNITSLTLGENITAGSNITIIEKTDSTGYIISATDSTGVLEKNIVEFVLNEDGTEFDTTYDDTTTGTIAVSGFVLPSEIVTINDSITTLQTDVATNSSNIATNTTNISTNTTDIATNTTNIATNTSDIITIKTEIEDINDNIQDLTIGDNITAGTNITIIQKSDNTGYIISAVDGSGTGLEKNIVELVMNSGGTELTVTYDDATTGSIAISGFVSTDDLTADLESLKDELNALITANTNDISNINTNITNINNDITDIKSDIENIDTNIIDINSSISTIDTEISSLKIGSNITAGDNVGIEVNTENDGFTLSFTGSTSDAKTITDLTLIDDGSSLDVIYDDESTGTITTSGFVSTNEIAEVNTDIDNLVTGSNLTAGSNVTITERTDGTGVIITANSSTSVLEKNIVELVLNDNASEFDVTYDDESTGTIATSGIATEESVTTLESTVSQNTTDITTNTTDISNLNTSVDTNTSDITTIKEEITNINTDIDNLIIGENVTAGSNVTLVLKSDNSGYIISANSSSTVLEKNIIELVLNTSGTELAVTYDDNTTGTIAVSGFVIDEDLENLKDELNTLISANTTSIEEINSEITNINNDITDIQEEIGINKDDISELKIGNNITAGENVSITVNTENDGFTLDFTGSTSDAKTITDLTLVDDGSSLSVTYDDSTTGTIDTTGFISTNEISDINTDIDNLTIGTNLTAGSNVTITERTDNTGVIITANSSTSVLEKNIIELVLTESGTELDVTYDDETTGTIASSGFVTESELETVQGDITTLQTSVSTNTSDISDLTTELTTVKTDVETNTTNITTNTSSITTINAEIEEINSDLDTVTLGENVTAGSNITIIQKSDNSGYIISATDSSTVLEKNIVELVLNDTGTELAVTYDDATTGTIAVSGFIIESDLDSLKDELNALITANTNSIETLETSFEVLSTEVATLSDTVTLNSDNITNLTKGDNVTAGDNITITINDDEDGYTISSNVESAKDIATLSLNDDGTVLTFIYDDETTDTAIADNFVSTNALSVVDTKTQTNLTYILEILDVEVTDYSDDEVSVSDILGILRSGAVTVGHYDTSTLSGLDDLTLGSLDGELKTLTTKDYVDYAISQATSTATTTSFNLASDSNNIIDNNTTSEYTTWSSQVINERINKRGYNYISITETSQDNSIIVDIKVEDDVEEVKFIATREYNLDDSYAINGTVYPVVTIGGADLVNGIWEKGSPVVLAIANEKLYLMNGIFI